MRGDRLGVVDRGAVGKIDVLDDAEILQEGQGSINCGEVRGVSLVRNGPLTSSAVACPSCSTACSTTSRCVRRRLPCSRSTVFQLRLDSGVATLTSRVALVAAIVVLTGLHRRLLPAVDAISRRRGRGTAIQGRLLDLG